MDALDFSGQSTATNPAKGLDFSSGSTAVKDPEPLSVDPYKAGGPGDALQVEYADPEQVIASPIRRTPKGSMTPDLDAAGMATIGGLAKTSAFVPMVAGGLGHYVGADASSDANFNAAQQMNSFGDALNEKANKRSKVGATIGGVASMVPLMFGGEALLPEAAAPAIGGIARVGQGLLRGTPLAAALGIDAGSQSATKSIDAGQSVGQAEATFATTTVGRTIANMLPMGVSGEVLAKLIPRGLAGTAAGEAIVKALTSQYGEAAARIIVGGASGAAGAAGSQELEHAVNPELVKEGATTEGVGTGALVGSILSVLMGGGGRSPMGADDGPGRSSFTPDVDAAGQPVPKTPPLGLPGGADYQGEFNVANAPQLSGPPPIRSLNPGADFASESSPVKQSGQPIAPGQFQVDAQGNAFTPSQGAQTLGQAMGLNQGGPSQLGAPVTRVDAQGNALTTADQNAAMQPPPVDPADAIRQALGLTPGTLRAQQTDPRTGRAGPPINPLGLPAPSIAVDPAGTAMTSADFTKQVRAGQDAQDAATAARADRANLGMTPDIERTQSRALNRQAPDEMSTQSDDDSPPWWLAGQHAAEQADNVSAGKIVANPRPQSATDLIKAENKAALEGNDGAAPKRTYARTGDLMKNGQRQNVAQMDYGTGDHLLHWIAANGGINRDAFQHETGLDPKVTTDDAIQNPLGIGQPAVRTNGKGMKPEEAFEKMQQDGWFQQHDENAPAKDGAQQAADMIHQALQGHTIHHPYEGAEQRMQSAADDHYAQEHADLEQYHAEQRDMTDAEIARTQKPLARADVGPADFHEALTLNQIIGHAMDAGVSTSDILDATFDAKPSEAGPKLQALTRAHVEKNNVPVKGSDAQRGQNVDRSENPRPAPAGSSRSNEVRGAVDGAVDKSAEPGASIGRPGPSAAVNRTETVKSYLGGTATIAINGPGEVPGSVKPIDATHYRVTSRLKRGDVSTPMTVVGHYKTAAEANAAYEHEKDRFSGALTGDSIKQDAPQDARNGLFAAPTAKEKLKGESDARDAKRNGLGRDLVKPEQGAGDLLAGDRPKQSDLDAQSKEADFQKMVAGIKARKAEVLAAKEAKEKAPGGEWQTKLAKILDDHDSGEGQDGYTQVSDVADSIESLIDDHNDVPKSLSKALDKFREAQDDDDNLSGRGDIEHDGEVFLEEAGRIAKQGNVVRSDSSSYGDQTQTPAFKKWFGDSKIVDDNGKPSVMYHGTREGGFHTFDLGKSGDSTGRQLEGIYFTNHKLGAETYSNTRSMAKVSKDPDFDPSEDGEPGNYAVYLSVKNPYEMDFEGRGWDGTGPDGDVDDYYNMDDVVQRAIEDGHDGVIASNINDEGSYGQGYGHGDKTVVVFKPGQIKSSDQNSGEFDGANPSIVKSDSPSYLSPREVANTPQFKSWFGSSKVVGADGQPQMVFHGSRRPDRIGDQFRKSRATSGPMAFFTDDPKIASNYSEQKSDTSLDDIQSQEEMFRYKVQGSRSTVDIARAWYHLSPEQKATVSANLPHVTDMTEDGNDSGGPIRLGGADEWVNGGARHWASELQQAKGNPLKAAVSTWIESGNLWNRTGDFMDVLKASGMPMDRTSFADPNYSAPAVLPVYLSIKNPFDTADAADILPALTKAGNRARNGDEYGVDSWDKRASQPQEWLDTLRHDISSGETFTWTTVPDWVTSVLKKMGYDGIQDKGGKNGGEGHNVWIPFDDSQVKSATGNNGDFGPSKSIVRSSSRDMFSSYKKDGAVELPEKTAPLPVDQRRPDYTPAVDKAARDAVDDIVKRAGGSVLGDGFTKGFRATGANALIGQTIKTHGDAAAAVYVYRNPNFETLRYIYLNKAGKVIGETAVSSRIANSSVLFPLGTQNHAQWVVDNAPIGTVKMVLSHNHPSGHPTPSNADRVITRRLRDDLAAIPGAPEIMTHIVTDHGTYGEINAAGNFLGLHDVPGISGPDPLLEKSGSMQNWIGAQITGPSDASIIAKRIADGVEKGSSAVIVMDNKNKITAIISLPNDHLATTKGAAVLSRISSKRGATRLILVAQAHDIAKYHEALEAGTDKGMFADVIAIDRYGGISQAAAGNITSGNFGVHSSAWIKRHSSGHQVREDTTGRYTSATRQEGMPHRNPGETQAQYNDRLMVKNRAEIKAATALVKLDRKLGRYEIRGMNAQTARAMEIANATFKQIGKEFDKTPDVINFASVHEWETGVPITDPDFRKFIGMMTHGFDQRIEAIQRLAPGALESLIANYMPHLYKDSGKASKWYQNILAKRPMAGDKGFLKQRTWPTMKEAMASGLEPISPNPVDWVLAKYAAMDKFIGAAQLRQNFDARGWNMVVRPGERIPPGMARVEDPAFLIAGGMQGSIVVPEMIAKDLNNFLRPGLNQYGIVRSFRAVQNLMVSAQLGWSAFHAGFTSIDNAVTHGAVGLQRLAMGDIKGGLKALVLAVPTMITSPFEGGNLNRQWVGKEAIDYGKSLVSGRVVTSPTDLNLAAIFDALVGGGTRMKMSASTAEYNNGLPKVLRTIRRLQAPGAVADRIDGVKNYMANHTAGESAVAGVVGSLNGIGHSLSAIGEVSSFLIHHVLVPNQKMAARVTLFKFELDRAAKIMAKKGYDVKMGDYAKILDIMHPDVIKQLASDVADKIDFRLGHMTYDNYFYPKIAREIGQMVFMALGWQAGAIQTLSGGFRDLGRIVKPEKFVAPLDKAGKITDAHRGRFTNNTANLIMLGLMVGGAGAVYQYLVSGQKPESLHDLVAPRTGRKNADDSDERMVFPSYLKDHYEVTQHPVQMILNKIHPMWRQMLELANNKDYFGNEIRNPKSPGAIQARQMADHLARGMIPFSVTNINKARDMGAGPGRMAANFVGVSNASAAMSGTPFQQFVAKGGDKGWSYPTSTPAERDYSDKMRAADTAMRTGQKPNLEGLTDRDVQKLEDNVDKLKPQTRFGKLSIEDKLDAYDLASPKEIERYNLKEMITTMKWASTPSAQRMSEDEFQQVQDKIDAIEQDGN